MVSTRQGTIDEIIKRMGIAAHVMMMMICAARHDENLRQANYRRDSHGGAIAPWLANALLTVIGNIGSGNFDRVVDYGSGDRLGVLLIGWIFAWAGVERMVGIEKDEARCKNGEDLLRKLNETASASDVETPMKFDLYEGSFLVKDDRLLVPEGKRAIVVVNNYDDCMLLIRGDLEEALSRNLTENSVVICFSRLFRPYDGRWTEEKFHATITADGLSWTSGSGEDKKIIDVFKYTRTQQRAEEGTVLTVKGRSEGRTCHTDETEEVVTVDLTSYRTLFPNLDVTH